MRPNFITILLFLSVITQSTVSKSPYEGQSRRILHQPLFPATSTPPPPNPPPPSGPDTLNPYQPFFHVPATPDQVQQPPPATTPLANSAATGAPNVARKVAIVLSSGILSLALLSVLAFYLYRRSSENQDESQKPFGSHSLTASQESRLPPSNFLYIGTVEPSAPTVGRETNAGHGSPYRKLNPGKRSDRYRPSPELQPLPPLPKPPPPPEAATSSPPPMSSSSSDDENHDKNFHTPQGSIMSNESPRSQYTYANDPISQISQVNGTRSENHSRLPHSKRTSPKSRLSAPFPDTKPVIIPSIKQPPPSVYTPKRPKFTRPPPPPDLARLQCISNEDQPARKIPIPPPPPAVVAAQASVPRKFRSVEPNTPSPVSKNVTGPDSSSPSSKASSGTGNIVIPSGGDGNKAVNSSEKNDRDDKDGPRPKLKPLHWDKVRATSERATVWDQLKSSSFQLNEDAMESLFSCNSITSVPKEAANRRKSALPGLEQENRVLDPKKSQNIAILIRALNVTREEVSEALLDGNPNGLGPELLETISKMAPTKEEEIKLKDYNGEVSKLGLAERFLKGVLDVPFAFKRVEAMLYRANFDAEVLYLTKSFQTLEEASEELKNSRLFLKLLEAVLRTGNRMNDGTNRGDARAFKLDTLLKLADVKGADGKTTLLHFVVQEIIRSEGPNLDLSKTDFEFKEEEFRRLGLQVVVRLSKELGSVKKAAGMDSDVLNGYVMKLETGLDNVRSTMQHEKQGLLQGKFFSSMKEFLEEADGEISRIKEEEGKALLQVKEVTEYFHGDAAKEEAHPLRIFLVVRDFLGILDNVCKDVGRMPAGATVGAGRSFRMIENGSRPAVLSRFHADFDDD